RSDPSEHVRITAATPSTVLLGRLQAREYADSTRARSGVIKIARRRLTWLARLSGPPTTDPDICSPVHKMFRAGMNKHGRKLRATALHFRQDALSKAGPKRTGSSSPTLGEYTGQVCPVRQGNKGHLVFPRYPTPTYR